MKSLNHLGYDVHGCVRGENRNYDIPYLMVDLLQSIQSDMDFDVIVHAAARSPEASFSEYFADNVIGTRNVIDFAKRSGAKKIIYLSAVSAFGNIDEVLSENSPHNNPGDYGLTKYVAEKLIRDSGLDYDVYILPGVVGEGCRNPYIIRLADALYQDHDVHCYNSDGMFNNVLLVSDLCRFIAQRIENGAKGDVFLLGCTEQMRVRDIVSILADKLNSKSKVEFDTERKGGFILNIEKALRAGFLPTKFRDILSNICDEVVKRRRQYQERVS